MRPENRDGVAVDPVPFLVVSAIGFVVCYSYGPAYLMALGASFCLSMAVTTAVFALTVAAAYRRYVWHARPDLRGEVPVDARLRRLVYGALVAVAVLALLALPLLL